MKLRSMDFLWALVLRVMVFPSGLLADGTPNVGATSVAGSAGTYSSGGADDPAVGYTGVTTNYTDGSWSLGYEFSTNTAIDVTVLGFYDATLTGGAVGLDNCSGCGEVGIYNSAGTLLVSGLATTSGTQVGGF